MQKNEKVRSMQRAVPHQDCGKDNVVQEVQKDKRDNASADAKTKSEEQHNAANRIHSIQQDKPDHHNEGVKGVMEYQKLKCVYCGYEMASRAKTPRCYKCLRRKFTVLQEFSVTKPFKLLKGGATMAKEKEAEKVEEKEEAAEEENDELDTLFD